MKRQFIFLLCALLPGFIQAKTITANFSCGAFNVPGHSPYIETYLSVNGSTVNFITDKSGLTQAQLEITYVIKSENKIVKFDKYMLMSPVITAADSAKPDFFDQHRLSVSNGDYNVELTVKDKNSDNPPVTISEPVMISFPSDSLSVSDIQLVEKFSKTSSPGSMTKNGYDIIPLVQKFLPAEINSLKFYAEIYNADKAVAGDYLVRCSISGNESKKIIGDYAVNLRESPKPVNVVFGELPIGELFSGNYYFNVEVRNNKNELIGFKSTFFQRSNPVNKPVVTEDFTSLDISRTFISTQVSEDSLNDFIACLYPISSSFEDEVQTNVIGLTDIHYKQQYIYHFWSSRNPADPGSAWNEYRKKVAVVNASYSTLNKKGYDTDRGRVYLQYGVPSSIASGIEDPETYPYEIWQYYKLEDQTNRKFVFYSPERASNNYRLMHSDAKGELQNAHWELDLHRTQQFNGDVDIDKSIDVYGSHTKENFENPH